MALPEEREDVVFAEGEDVEVLDGHHLVVAFVEEGALEHFPRILAVPGGEKAHRLFEPLGGFLQPLPFGVLSNLDEQVAGEILHNGVIISQGEVRPKMKKGTAKPVPGSIAEGWKEALRNEIEGREFYRMAAANASLDGVRQMFTFLMEEEERHREAILEQIGRMARGKRPRFVRKGSGKREIRKFRSPLFPPEFVAEGTKAEGEAAALSIGMTLERRAIAQFSALRKKAEGDEASEKIFDDLIAWEREHLEILARQFEQLREMYWEEARFWPF